MLRLGNYVSKAQIMLQFAAIMEGGDIRNTPKGSTVTTPQINPRTELPGLHQQLDIPSRHSQLYGDGFLEPIPAVQIHIHEPDTPTQDDDESITPKPLSPRWSKRSSPREAATP